VRHHWKDQQDGTVTKTPAKSSAKNEKAAFNKDRRRKHHHWLVTVFYADGEKFGRVYTDKDKATRFADRQKRSPVVKSARITQVS
jgi:hypothetical protein